MDPAVDRPDRGGGRGRVTLESGCRWNAAAATRCVPGATQCVSAATQCVSAATRCVSGATRCVSAATRCVSAATRCVSAATRCVSAATRCVSGATRCVSGATRCVRLVTHCVPPRTQCATNHEFLRAARRFSRSAVARRSVDGSHRSGTHERRPRHCTRAVATPLNRAVNAPAIASGGRFRARRTFRRATSRLLLHFGEVEG